MSDTSPTTPFSRIIAEYNAVRRCADKGALCHAPESSMFFGRDGTVSACCYSRSAPFGSYPSQTVSEIWNSAQARSMRIALRKNTLPEGCGLCADKLMARNFTQLVAQSFDALALPPASSTPLDRIAKRLFPREPERWPLQMEFELSNKCNLACTMCSGFYSSTIRATRDKLPALPEVYDDAFVEQLRPFLPHLRRAKFLGGEPFLIDVYYKIWDLLIELNPACDVSVTTNGTVFNKAVKRVLERLNCQVIISLDSVNKPTYEQIRINAKMERTLENVDAIMEVNRRKGKPLFIAVCPMASNWREIPDLVRFANARGMSVIFNIVVFPMEHSLQSLPQETKREIVELFRSACSAPMNAIESGNYTALSDLSNQVDYWSRPASAGSSLQQRCLQWLEERRRAPAIGEGKDPQRLWLEAALSDIAAPTNLADLAPIPDQDVKSAIKHYFRGIWWIGRRLEADSGAISARYSDEKLAKLETFLEQHVGTASARRVMMETRRFASTTLELCGNRSGEQVIQIIRETYGIAGGESSAK